MPKAAHPKVAVIGMGCWYPGAADVRLLWQNVLSSRQQFREFPDTRLPLADYYSPDQNAPEKTYGRRGAFIDGFLFDWEKRRIPYSVVGATDIVHWLALEVALQALAHAGYEAATLPQERTCVLVGNTLTGEHTRSNAMRQRWPYVRRALMAAAGGFVPASQLQDFVTRMERFYTSPLAPTTEDTLAGGLSNTIAGRICNFLNLGGGGYTVDGACSSSLIAVANAAAAVAAGEAEVALAGGVDVSLDTFELIGFAKTGALTAGDMNVYDKAGQGFIPGEGCGFVVLKKHDSAVRDGDTIYAVVRGWGVSSDGKGGITAPKASGQALALSRAYARAGYRVQDVDFIEGHGTGTAVGDRVELQGIALAAEEAGDWPARSVGITSFKSLVGHTKAAAGIGGFIKAVLAVNQRVIPPTVGCHVPHPAFDLEAKGLYPVREGAVRDRASMLRAGVSGMGFGGINCHVTLESADPPVSLLPEGVDEEMLFASAQGAEVFMFAAPSHSELREAVQELLALSKGIAMAELRDLAAQVNSALASIASAPCRAAVVASSPDDLPVKLNVLLQALDKELPERLQMLNKDIVIGGARPVRVGFLFPGQGSQQINMARFLVRRHLWAREIMEKADHVLALHGFNPIGDIMFRPMDRAFGTPLAVQWTKFLKDTRNTQVAICVASMLFAEYLRRLGVQPTVVAGHSLGELCALCAAGAMSFDVLVRLVAERGLAMAEQSDQPGAMLSLACSELEAVEMLTHGPGAVVACVNAPRQTVIAGDASTLNSIANRAAAQGLSTRKLQVSNAFHSDFVAHAGRRLARLRWLSAEAVLQVPFLSSLDATLYNERIDLKDYCARQVVEPVRFLDAAKTLPSMCDLMVEVGPGRALCGLAEEILGSSGPLVLPLESSSGSSLDQARAVATLFAAGCEINAEVLYENRLIRPFVPAASRRFIDNPCERASDEEEITQVNGAAASTTSILRATLPNLPTSLLEDYLSRRAGFIEQVIRADIDCGMPSSAVLSPPYYAAMPDPAAAKLPGDGLVEQTALALLCDQIAQQTGFDAQSLHHNLRLLDDLNLDSIKAADLLARVAGRRGVTGFDPASLLNATLAEIAAALDSHSAVQAPSPGTGTASPYASLLRRVAMRTGFDAASLKPELRMIDDLNLDSIKVGDILAETAKEFGLSGILNPVEVANASLGEIAARIEETVRRQGTDPAKRLAPRDIAFSQLQSWVRDFSPEWVGEADTQFPAPPLKEAKVLVLGEGARCAALAREIELRGAEVCVTTYDKAEALVANPEFDGCVAILELNAEDDICRSVSKLQVTAQRPNTPLAPEKPWSMSYVMFGPAPGIHGFAASLHLERPDLTVRALEFCEGDSAVAACSALVNELALPEAFVSAKYSADGQRQTMRMRLNNPVEYRPRNIAWNKEDVVLVSGGGKGITAECALGLFKVYGLRLALVGSTDFAEREPDGEVGATLRRLEEAGALARYYACDVSCQDQVNLLLSRIATEMGPVTAVLHGAGINKPRRAETASEDSILAEIAPKVRGAANLLRALEGKGIKAFCALTSIIGITGMPGNAWYAFSNEWVDDLLRRHALAHPETACFSIAYSVWGEVGMGARLASVSKLEAMGIGAIPTAVGVEHFLRLWDAQGPSSPTVVTARLAGLDTWPRRDYDLGSNLRFVREVVRCEPGVELVARVLLHPDTDPYLTDHNYRGSLLFPTVFGMEAMAQACARVLGRLDLFAPGAQVTFESLRLDRPIVVNQETGTWIEIRAQVDDFAIDELSVRVSLHSEASGWNPSHFSSRLVFGRNQIRAGAERLNEHEQLALQPREDLYGPLLFQGPRFHRIRSLRRLVSSGKYEGEAVLDVEAIDSASYIDHSFAGGSHSMLLGDPFLRDAILQSGQLLIPQHLCLPIAIDQVAIRLGQTDQGVLHLHTTLHGRNDRDVLASCALRSSDGTTLEELQGYRVRIVDELPNNPTLEQLADLPAWEAGERAKALSRVLADAGVSDVHLDFVPMPGVHSWSRSERHDHERQTVATLWSRIGGGPSVQLGWRSDNRPVLEGDGSGVSISHDDDMGLVVLHKQRSIGCDLALVGSRSREQWLGLLGVTYGAVLDQLIGDVDDLDLAGTRLWAAREALIKLGIREDVVIHVGGEHADWIELLAQAQGQQVKIVTTVLSRWRGGRCVAAIAIETTGNAMLPAAPEHPPQDFKQLVQTWTERVAGVMCLYHQFPMQLDDVSTLSRKVSPSRYFAWMGKLRELSLLDVMSKFTQAAQTGKWGSVTNSSELEVYADIAGDDHLLGTMYAVRLPDSDDSTMDLFFDWFRVRGATAPTAVATSSMRMSWVEILGHGHVAKRPLPTFLRAFFNDMGELHTSTRKATSLGHAGLDSGKVMTSYVNTFGAAPLLHSETFLTDQEDSNLIGNVYHSNYAKWQCRTRDRYLHSLMPGYFRGEGPTGEWMCKRSRMTYLRDAMPFDVVQADMQLLELRENGVRLSFSFFRKDPGEGRTKLAHGEEEIVWTRNDGPDRTVAQPIPDGWLRAMSAQTDRIQVSPLFAVTT